jgi:type II secretory pathway component PulJ
VHDKSGQIYTVRYEAVNAMLLNEFLKEHQKVEDQDRRLQEQQAMIAQLRKDLQVTEAQQQKKIEGLAASLQKVSAQLEVTKSAPQTVLNY